MSTFAIVDPGTGFLRPTYYFVFARESPCVGRIVMITSEPGRAAMLAKSRAECIAWYSGVDEELRVGDRVEFHEDQPLRRIT